MSWSVLPLKRTTRVVNGGTPKPDADNWDGDIPWATPADFDETLSRISSTRRNLTSQGALAGSTVVPPGSVLLSTRAPIGHVAVTDVPMAFNQGCRALVPSDAIDPRFLGYQLESLREPLQARGLGTTFVELSSDSLAATLIPVPEIEEQRRIAAFLDAETTRIDRMRSRAERQSLVLSERLAESFRAATTIGSGRVRDTDIPWMPKMDNSWQLVKVSHAFRTGSGTTPASGNPEYFDGPYPWINSSDLNDGVIESAPKSVTESALASFSALTIHPGGSLVIALYGQGATKGRVGVLRFAACVNQACCVMGPDGPVTVEYAAYWFRAHKQGIIGLAVGAGQPNLSQELIRQLRIPTPNVGEQRKITNTLAELEKGTQQKLKLLALRNSLLTERRQALITAAVTGQIDVSTASGRGVTEELS